MTRRADAATRIRLPTATWPSRCGTGSARRRSCAWTSRPARPARSGAMPVAGGVAGLETSARFPGRNAHRGAPARAARWRLVTLPADGGAVHEIDFGRPPLVGPAWSADGAGIFVTSDGSGIWNIVVATSSAGPGGGAHAGDRRRLRPGAHSGREGALLSRFVGARRFGAAAVSSGGASGPRRPAHPRYPPRLGDAAVCEAPVPVEAVLRVAVAGGSSADRLFVRALGQHCAARRRQRRRAGSAARSRDGLDRRRGRAARRLDCGGVSRASVALSSQLFSAIEKPGNQGLAARPEFDEERWGGFVRRRGRGRSRGAASRRTRAAAPLGSRRWRPADSAARWVPRARLAFRRTRGRGASASTSTPGAGRRDRRLVVEPVGRGRSGRPASCPFASLRSAAATATPAARRRVSTSTRSAARPSAILPPGLDRNRIQRPGAAGGSSRRGERFEAYGVEARGQRRPDRPVRRVAAGVERRDGVAAGSRARRRRRERVSSG